MFDYQLFGGVLRSAFEFPELQRVSTSNPDWVLTTTSAAPPVELGEMLGSDSVTGTVQVTLYRRARGFRMVFDDTGCFDISADGRSIAWYQQPEISAADARTDLTSRVLAAALHAAGTLSLHGSAVALHEHAAIGLIAPKRHGKSTLALALVGAGARLLTDDTLPVDPGPPVLARPGLHATRLWPDSAERVALGRALTADEGAKRVYSDLPEEHLGHAPAPLAALYMLKPEKHAQDGQAVWREPVPAIQAALLLIANAKLAPLLGKSESPVLFERAVAIARQVPVYHLHVLRDMERLDEVVTQLQHWHLQPAAAAT